MLINKIKRYFSVSDIILKKSKIGLSGTWMKRFDGVCEIVMVT